MNKEVWRDIPGYKNKYQVSSKGRVKSLSRKVRSRNWYTKNPFFRTINERLLKPGRYTKSGHLSVVLGRGSNGVPVHQLVMKTFVGEPADGHEVMHINGNPQDNRLSNLRYGTRTENILDVYIQGKRWRKLSIEDVYDIRFRLLCGFSGKELAEIYNISPSTVSHIKVGRSYSWLK